MPTPNIYNNKYMPGPLPEICAPCKKLLACLEQEAQKRLIFIFAPAGSGKNHAENRTFTQHGQNACKAGL